MSEDKTCREAFEAWCKQRGQNVTRDDRPDFADGYLNLITQCFWVGWQAGRAAKAAVPSGYAIVPMEPTPEMKRAPWVNTRHIVEPDDADDIWSAMIAAAPAPPETK